jgi:hypothetical protein
LATKSDILLFFVLVVVGAARLVAGSGSMHGRVRLQLVLWVSVAACGVVVLL